MGPQCLQFWYHMYGSAETMGLQIYLLQNSLASVIWQKSNNQGQRWHLAQVDFNTTEAFQVRFFLSLWIVCITWLISKISLQFKIIIEGRGGSNQSNVAMDDLKVYPGHCAGN